MSAGQPPTIPLRGRVARWYSAAMPLPIAILAGFALGAAFALAAKGELARLDGPLVTSRVAAIVAAFAAFVYAPAVAYFAAFHGDWAYLYVVPWQSVPSAVDLTLVIVAAAAVPVGFAAGARAHGHPRAGRWLAGGPAIAAALVAAIFVRRLLVSASYAQYHGAFGVEPIGASALGKGVLLGVVAVGAGAAWAVRALRAAPG